MKSVNGIEFHAFFSTNQHIYQKNSQFFKFLQIFVKIPSHLFSTESVDVKLI